MDRQVENLFDKTEVANSVLFLLGPYSKKSPARSFMSTTERRGSEETFCLAKRCGNSDGADPKIGAAQRSFYPA
jgi:hypothetical protein